MRIEFKQCMICPIKETCDPHLLPESVDGKNTFINPWRCRHLTCPAGVDAANKEIKRLKDNGVYFGYAYFQTRDKPNERRVLQNSRIIESSQDGEWYSTGQSLNKTYLIDSQYLPLIKAKFKDK